MPQPTSEHTSAEKAWLARLTRLNPAAGTGRQSGKAPHKPLLLLSLLDAFEDGEIASTVFTKTADLVVRFLNYSAITASRWPNKLKIQMPFFHLSNQGFWVSFDETMKPATVDTAVVNEMDPELFGFCLTPGFRIKARMILISAYFTPAEKIALFEAVGLSSHSMAAKARAVVREADATAAAEQKGRSARFRSEVIIKYQRTCALTGYRCDTVDGTSIVEAAHIDAWSESQNDEVHNGLALSRNAHWMFDQGLWSVDDDLRILVNDRRFQEAGPDALLLRNLKGRHLQFDPKAVLRPDSRLLRLHRKKFLGLGA